MKEALRFRQKDARPRECGSQGPVCTAELVITGRAGLSEAESGEGDSSGLSPGWTSRPMDLPGQAPTESQTLLSPAALGHKVQWGDFVISSQDSLKGLASPPRINDNP